MSLALTSLVQGTGMHTGQTFFLQKTTQRLNQHVESFLEFLLYVPLLMHCCTSWHVTVICILVWCCETIGRNVNLSWAFTCVDENKQNCDSHLKTLICTITTGEKLIRKPKDFLAFPFSERCLLSQMKKVHLFLDSKANMRVGVNHIVVYVTGIFCVLLCYTDGLFWTVVERLSYSISVWAVCCSL